MKTSTPKIQRVLSPQYIGLAVIVLLAIVTERMLIAKSDLDWVTTHYWSASVEDYEAFVANHPTSEQKEEALWQIAVLRDNLKAYQVYYDAFPFGKYKEEALKKINQLERGQDRQKEENRQILKSSINPTYELVVEERKAAPENEKQASQSKSKSKSLEEIGYMPFPNERIEVEPEPPSFRERVRLLADPTPVLENYLFPKSGATPYSYHPQEEDPIDVWEIKKGRFEDPRDGRVYAYASLGDGLKWMVQNLNFHTNYGSWCYDNNLNNCDASGRLYYWKKALEVCPPGWRLPTEKEWWGLLKIYGEILIDDETESASYIPHEAFNALADLGFIQSKFDFGGMKQDQGHFLQHQNWGTFWTRSSIDTDKIWYVKFDNVAGEVRILPSVPYHGYSCRCVQG